jgi:hypothetical protein
MGHGVLVVGDAVVESSWIHPICRWQSVASRACIALERFLLPQTDSLLFPLVRAGAAYIVPEDRSLFLLAAIIYGHRPVSPR